MSFDLDALIAEAGNEPFEFVYRGDTYRLPHAKALTVQQQLTIAAHGDMDGVTKVLDEVAPGMATVLLGMPGHAAVAVINAWHKHSGVEEGESLASTDSSASTERPSSTTFGRVPTHPSAIPLPPGLAH